MKDVFISYAQADTIQAHSIAQSLERGGYSSWLFEKNGLAARWHRNQTEDAIARCNAFILIISQASVFSDEVDLEVACANRLHKPIFPILHRIDWTRAMGASPLMKSILEGKRTSISLSESDFSKTITTLIDSLRSEGFNGSSAASSPASDSAIKKRKRIVPVLPDGPLPHFKDRIGELDALKRFISNRNLRFVLITGRSGVGKTTLILKLIQELDETLKNHEDTPADGIDSIIRCDLKDEGYRSPDKIASQLFSTLEDELSKEFRLAWENKTSLKEGLELLFGRLLQGTRRLIVLDNFEDLLDESYRIKSKYDGIEKFIMDCLMYNHSALVIATSRKEMVFPPEIVGRIVGRWIKLSLDKGLPEEDAIALLRVLDEDGKLGMRDAPDELLKEVVKRCDFLPKTLEAVFAALEGDILMNLRKLVADNNRFSNLIHNPSKELFSSLSEDREKPAVEAIAVYGCPMPLSAIYYLYPDLPLDDILNSLVRCLLVKFDKNTEMFSLHSMDQNYVHSNISDIRRRGLHKKAAEYFATQRKCKSEWMSYDDIQPQINEFKHLTLAEEYDVACSLLNTIDREYLAVWGYYDLLIEFRRQLLGKIRDRKLEELNLGNLGCAYFESNHPPEKAEELYQEALAISREIQNQADECRWIGNLGIVKRNLGNMETAKELLQEGYDLALRIVDRLHEGRWLGKITEMQLSLGEIDYEKAISSYQKAIELAREPDVRDRRFEMYWLINLAELYWFSKKYDEYFAYHKEAANAASLIGDRQRQTGTLLTLGERFLYLKRFEEATECLEEAFAIIGKTGNLISEYNLLIQLGDIYRSLDEASIAIGHYEKALNLLDQLGGQVDSLELLNCLGIAHYQVGDFRQSIQYYQKYLDEARKCNRSQAEGIALYNIGDAYHQIAEYQKASEYYQLSLHMNIPITNYKCAIGLGLIYLQEGEKEEARQFLRHAVEFSKEQLNENPLLCKQAYSLSLALLANNEKDAAIDAYRNALTTFTAYDEIHFALQDLGLLSRAAPETQGLIETENLLKEALKNKDAR